MLLCTLAAIPAVAGPKKAKGTRQDVMGEGLARLFRDKPLMVLWASMSTFNAMDMHVTIEAQAAGGFHEDNPLVRPLLGQPAPAIYLEQQGMIAGLALVGHKMRESKHRFIRALWWVPLAFQVQANLRGWLRDRRWLSHRGGP